MKTNLLNLNIPIIIILLMLSSLIPWPGPTIFKISCPRENTRIVRKIVQSKWIPVLDKFKVKLPIECPFHPQRDIFGPQQAAKKQHRPSQWTCDICGKSFFEEKYLDLHFDNRHREYINMAEDAICLADYCDIMRCDVMNNLDWKSITSDHDNTDIEIWREASSYSSKSLISTVPASTSSSSDITTFKKYTLKNGKFILLDNNDEEKYKKTVMSNEKRCQKGEAPLTDDASINLKDDNTSSPNGQQQQNSSLNNNICQSDLVDAALPAPNNRQQRLNEIQKLKANCKPEELQKLKIKCEILIRDCIASLLIPLNVKDFKEIEDELNRAVCWYLTCDRYWEDSQTDLKTFPWGLICMIIMVLSLGICLCYYIVWVLFDSTDDVSVTTSTSVTDRSTPSPAHLLRATELTDGGGGGSGVAHHQVYSEDYVSSTEKDNEYIYVTYPPELKRRLMESCYNRTTRL